MKPVLPCGKEPGQLLKDNPGLGKKSEKGMLGGGRKGMKGNLEGSAVVWRGKEGVNLENIGIT